MGNDVFANGRELACKAGTGKSVCAFPDVCMTPPMTPVTPPGVPVPYPNTGMASDTTSGSTTVKISGKEVMLKSKSYFKSSMGNEAGCAAKKGVVSSVNRGKVYFAAWSMDVKIEGENAVRHLDMTTHNHGSAPQTPPWPFADSMAIGPDGESNDPCAKEKKRLERACSGAQTTSSGTRDCSTARNPKGCKKAMACMLVPKGKDKAMCCAPTNTGHHMIEDNWVRKGRHPNKTARPGFGDYDYDKAPCVCANKRVSRGSVHRRMHNIQGAHEETFLPGTASRPPGKNCNSTFNYGEGKKATLTAHRTIFKTSNCSRSCIESQLDEYFCKQLKNVNNSTALKPPSRRRGLGESTRRRLSGLRIR